MQCQSGLDDYAVSTLCGPPVLDGHWGGDPLACVGKPCGASNTSYARLTHVLQIYF